MNENELVENLNSCGIPDKMHGAIIRYIVNHCEPGNFLCAVIENDLKDSFRCADDENKLIIENYIRFFYNYAPSDCWGSPEKMAEWLLRVRSIDENHLYTLRKIKRLMDE